MNRQLFLSIALFVTVCLSSVWAQYDNPYAEGEKVDMEPVEDNPYADKTSEVNLQKEVNKPVERKDVKLTASLAESDKLERQLMRLNRLILKSQFEESKAILIEMETSEKNKELVSIYREFISELQKVSTKDERFKVHMRYAGKKLIIMGKRFDDIANAYDAGGS